MKGQNSTPVSSHVQEKREKSGAMETHNDAENRALSHDQIINFKDEILILNTYFKNNIATILQSPVLELTRNNSSPNEITITSSGLLGAQYPYMAKDGSMHSDVAGLNAANEAYNSQMFPLKAKDGSMHSDLESLNAANETYNRQMFPLKANDGSLHPDMAGVEQANKAFWDSMKIIPKEDYIIPILPKEDLKIFLKNPK